jgi:hypothetical protein
MSVRSQEPGAAGNASVVPLNIRNLTCTVARNQLQQCKLMCSRLIASLGRLLPARAR